MNKIIYILLTIIIISPLISSFNFNDNNFNFGLPENQLTYNFFNSTNNTYYTNNFDQSLNTTDYVTFSIVNVTQNTICNSTACFTLQELNTTGAGGSSNWQDVGSSYLGPLNSPRNVSTNYSFMINTIPVLWKAAQDTLNVGEDATCTGDESTCIGVDAGKASTKVRLTAVGHDAGGTTDSLQESVVIGTEAARAATGSGVVYIGYEAGEGEDDNYNTCVGYRCMKTWTGANTVAFGANTATEGTASGCVFIGTNAGATTAGAGVTGTNNIGIGTQALTGVTSGASNVAIGYQTGMNITTGTQNIFMGTASGTETASTASNNVCIGKETCNDLQSNGNFFMGTETGRYHTEGGGNMILGYKAGATNNAINTNAQFNTAIGYYSFQNIDQGDFNTYIGGYAGIKNNNGTRIVGIGYESAYNQQGDDSIFIGAKSGYGDATSDNYGNVCIGLESCESLNTGILNTAIGNYAGEAMTNPRYNLFVGYEAGKTIGTGWDNACVGKGSCSAAATGIYYATCMGYDSCFNNAANYNVGIGSLSLKNPKGDSNVCIGDSACEGVTRKADTDRAICIGRSACENIDEGDDVIGIGYAANQNAANFSTSACIGTACQPDADNQFVFGSNNYEYTEFVLGPVSDATPVDVKIRGSNATGDTQGASLYISGGSSEESVGGNVILAHDGVGAVGYVGIGGVPSYPLHVYGGVDDISIYAEKNISATGFITRTEVFDTSESVWDYIKNSTYYLTDGIIDHSKFYGGISYEVTDYSRPEIVEEEIEVCEYEETITQNSTAIAIVDSYNKLNEIEKEESKINIIQAESNQLIVTKTPVCHNEFYYKTTYPYTKIEEGVKVDAEVELLRQAVYELNERVKYLEANCVVK